LVRPVQARDLEIEQRGPALHPLKRRTVGELYVRRLVVGRHLQQLHAGQLFGGR